MLELGHTKTVLCGHDHTNSFSTVYRGVRFAYSLKTGPGCNWDPRATGGTVIEIGADGSAALRHKYVAY